jgi:hypothetical protein
MRMGFGVSNICTIVAPLRLSVALVEYSANYLSEFQISDLYIWDSIT